MEKLWVGEDERVLVDMAHCAGLLMVMVVWHNVGRVW